MQAYRRTRWQQPARQEAVRVPGPRTGEVRQRIGGAGAIAPISTGWTGPKGNCPSGRRSGSVTTTHAAERPARSAKVVSATVR